MNDYLCFSVDAESQSGQPIAAKFAVEGFPTLLFLNPDGSVRDRIGGYLPPEPFIAEVERIGRDEGTISGLTREVAKDPKNLEARLELAVKLQSIGDQAAYDEHVKAIQELDPEGKSVASKTLEFDRIVEALQAAGQNLDPAALETFASEVSDPKLLFRSHATLGSVYQFQAPRAKDDAARSALMAKTIAAFRVAWKNCPDEFKTNYGNSIAYGLWEARDQIDAETKAFALEVVREVAEAAKDNADVLDTLACCLFMNGHAEKALAIIDRCAELAPENESWPARRELFRAAGD